MILDKDESLEKEADKMQEECEELIRAIELKDKDNTLEEIWDVIQVAVGMLYTLQETENANIKISLQKHLKKLVDRGWKDKGEVLIQVIKW